MKRFFELLVIVAALGAGVPSSHAQSSGKVWRIGILTWAP